MSSNKWENYIDDLLAQPNFLPQDLSIDDRDLPAAENVIDFFYNERFLKNMVPDGLFPRQISILLHLMGEFCPRCSDMEYFNNIAVDENTDQILDKVQLLKYGVCPKCGAHKSELYATGELDIPNEFIGLCGQRCVTGDTLIPTNFGIFTFKELASYQENMEGFSDYKTKIHLITDRRLVLLPEKFYKKENEDIFKVKTKSNYYIKGTQEHPIFTKDGFEKISNLKVGQAVPIYYNANIFGNNHEWTTEHKPFVSFAEFRSNARKRLKQSKQPKNIIKVTYPELKPDEDFCKMLGFWVAEGCKSAVISNTDQNVLDFCENQLKRLIREKDLILRGPNWVGSKLLGICYYFDEIIGGTLTSGSSGKHIPSWIFKCNKAYQAAFLQALFEGDGGIEGHCITYGSKSEQLINELKNILLNFGIACRTSHCIKLATNGSVNQKPCDYYTLAINGKFLEIFQKEINFFSERKRKSLQDCVEFYNNSEKNITFWYDKFPSCIKEDFFNLLKDITSDIEGIQVYDFINQGLKAGRLNHLMFFTNTLKPIRDDVGLTRNNLRWMYELIKSSPKYIHISLENRAKLEKFYLKYMEDGIFWDEISSIEYLGKDTVYDVTIPNKHCFLGNGFLNHNSGKSALTAMTISYVLHKFLKVPNLARTYKLLPSSPFTCPLVALSFNKALELLYNPLYNYLTNGNWYKEYHNFLKEQQYKFDQEIFAVKDTFARYRHRNILVIPLGPDKRKLRGNTSLIGAVDELSWMISTGKDNIKFDADEIYTSLNNSFMTARSSAMRLLKEGYDNLPQPMLFDISSPSSKKDKTCRLYEESKTSRRIYGVHYATWELNPTLPFEGEEMQGELKKLGQRFWRDFGAIPPNSSSPFMSSIELLKSNCSNNSNLSKITKKTNYIQTQEFTHGDLVIPCQQSGNIPNRILAMDAGVINNSFSFVLAHMETVPGATVLDKDKKIVVFDSLMEIIPEENKPLNFSKIFDNVIVPCIKNLNVKLVCTDRWQNLKILSDIQNDKALNNCLTAQYSVKYSDFIEYKQAFLDNAVRIPKPELKWDEIELHGGDNYPYCFENMPISHYIFQCLTVEDKMGKTVEKGEGCTDDIFRASVLAYTKLLDPNYSRIFSGFVSGIQTSRMVGCRASSLGMSRQFGMSNRRIF